MAYTAETLFHLKFDAEPLMNSVTSSFFNAVGNTPKLVEGVFDKAWKMDDTIYVESSDPIALSSAFTIGFWLKSVHLGVVTNPSTNATQPLKMPLLSKATFLVGPTISAPSYTFIIWEESLVNGKNVMKIKIKGAGSDYVATTSEYEVGYFKHFWLVYDGSTFRVFIDTIEDFEMTETGTLPNGLPANSDELSINENVEGEAWEISRNRGTLDDLVIFDSAYMNVETVKRAANSGVLYVSDTSYLSLRELDQVAIFDDPGTATITAVHSKGDKVYVSRSDGKILTGTKLIWESRRNFGKEKEADSLTIVNQGDSGLFSVADGSMSLQEKIVRV